MFESLRSSSVKKFLLFTLIFLLATNLSILLNILFFRQVLGFAFFTFVPGFLILYLLKLDKLGLIEKFVLSVGLSISFLMFVGLLFNWIYPAFGYYRPLSTNSLLISFSVIILLLAFVAYLRNQEGSFIKLSDFKLNTAEKRFLLLPALFPLLSILGMYIMNATDNNTMLMVLLFLIPAYAVFIVVKHKDVSDSVYAPIILFTSISLVLLLALRSSYIIGVDAHLEYYLFRQTFYNALWQILLYNPLDACLSVSILPTIYHSFLNIDSQYLFKILYPLLFSISPLIVYLISKKYIGSRYAFLSSFFFMSQTMFLWTTFNPRTSLAILFFGLAIMTLLSNRLGTMNENLLFIIFAFSCIVSHYSTAYIFFFIMVFTWFGMQIIPIIVLFQRGSTLLSNRSISGNPSRLTSQDTTLETCQSIPRNRITFGIVILIFVLIFFWYSQVTGVAFHAGVGFVARSLTSLYDFFIMEAREPEVMRAFGIGIWEREIFRQIHFVFSWLTIALIAIGVLTTSNKYRYVFGLSDTIKGSPSEFSLQNIDSLFLILALTSSTIMTAAVALPFVFIGYGMDRAFAQMVIVLSPFFVIGGIEISRFFRAKKAYIVVLIVLIPFFMCQTGTMHEVFGVPQSLVLNSEGESYDMHYVHDQVNYGAKWLKVYGQDNIRVYTDFFEIFKLISQAGFSPNSIDRYSLTHHKKIDGYIYLGYYNVVNDKLVGRNKSTRIFTSYNLTEFDGVFVGGNKIYNNGGAKVWKIISRS